MRIKYFFLLLILIVIAAFVILYPQKQNTDLVFKTYFIDKGLINTADFDNKKNIIYSYHYDGYNTYSDKLENYIIGVVAAEMPVDFCKEALKAQAVAARTYCVKNRVDIKNIDPSKIYQSYYSAEQLKKRWGSNFDEYYCKIQSAVNETKGIIMTYDGEAVTAVFHSMSGGMTENSGDVWGQDLPYLVSRPSDIEKKAPDFNTVVTISRADFEKKLYLYGFKAGAEQFRITEKTNAGYVKKVSIGGNTVSGNKIREIFGLRSDCFEYSYDSKNVYFNVRGYGHGVGMSQYGAEFMARSGSNFDDILKYYYTGIDFAVLEG